MPRWTQRRTEGRVWFQVGEAGPAVLLMHEIPGISRGLTDWANELADDGFRVIVPTLLDPDGRPGLLRVREGRGPGVPARAARPGLSCAGSRHPA